jgi:hypothetical protein
MEKRDTNEGRGSSTSEQEAEGFGSEEEEIVIGM